MLPRAMT